MACSDALVRTVFCAHTSEAAKEGVPESGEQSVRYTVSMHLYFL